MLLQKQSPSQTADEYNNFQIYLENALSQIKYLKSSLTAVLRDFDVISTSWYSKDITTNEGSRIEFLTTNDDSHQLTSDPTYTLPNS